MKEKTNAKHMPTSFTRDEVALLSGFGSSGIEIAAYLGIPVAILRELYGQELRMGLTKANVVVIKNLYVLSTGSGKDALAASALWLKFGGHSASPARVASPAAEKPGKKQLADEASKTAAEDTAWADLVH